MSTQVAGRIWFVALSVFFVFASHASWAQGVRELHRTIQVSLAEPVKLEVDLPTGDLQVAYAREGQVSISVTAQAAAALHLPEDFMASQVMVEHDGNHVAIRWAPQPGASLGDLKISYRIDVPYRTEVHSFVDHGTQMITGVLGPVSAETGNGNIGVSYVSKRVAVQAESGDLDLQVVGEHAEANTGMGNISCTRAAQGITAMTREGDISLMVVGNSDATVRHGTGRIDVGGVRGQLVASTDAGDLHVKAVVHEDWQLSSVTGNIRIELPPAAKFDLTANTRSGQFSVNRDDLDKPSPTAHEFAGKANGGGKHITVSTERGTVSIG